MTHKNYTPRNKHIGVMVTQDIFDIVGKNEKLERYGNSKSSKVQGILMEKLREMKLI